MVHMTQSSKWILNPALKINIRNICTYLKCSSIVDQKNYVRYLFVNVNIHLKNNNFIVEIYVYIIHIYAHTWKGTEKPLKKKNEN